MTKDAVNEVIKREKAREQKVIDAKNTKVQIHKLRKQLTEDARLWYAEYFETRYNIKLSKFHHLLLKMCPDICYRMIAAKMFVPVESHEIHKKYDIRRAVRNERTNVRVYTVRHKLSPFNKDVMTNISCVENK